MNRSLPFSKFMRVVSVALIASSLSLSGCSSFLTTALYLIKGNSIDPEFTQLAGKKVAIVCRPLIHLSFNSGKVDSQLARELGYRLSQNNRKIKVIDPQKVEEWTDSHELAGSRDFVEIGKGLGADAVVAIDLHDFQTHAGQTLYQGKGKVTVKVYDIKDDGRIVFQKHLPQFVYPPNAGRPTGEMDVEEFRREFVGVFAEEIGHLFYPYEAKENYARDTAMLR